jgi:hypothetical protein
MTRHIIPKARRKNHIVTLKEKEVLKGESSIVGIIFLEEEEYAEEEK